MVPSLIISLHDVTSSTFHRTEQQVRDLEELGIDRLTLLAVPKYHGKEALEEDARLCKWLRGAVDRGHEAVLHGWVHQVEGGVRRSTSCLAEAFGEGRVDVRRCFYENLYTSGEAEFLTLDYHEASTRIQAGNEMMKRLGFQPKGFIAPAWLDNKEVQRAAKDQGFLYTNTVSDLTHLPSGRTFESRSLVWSTRAGWRRVSSLAWNAFLFSQRKQAELMRISLHPCDLDYPSIWRHIVNLICAAKRNRKCTTYGEWIENRILRSV